jgi:O-antigen ligase
LTAIGWGLLTLCWLLPNHYPPWLNFHAEALALAAVATLVGSVLWKSGTVQPRWPALASWISLFAALPWIQWAFGITFFAGDALMNAYCLMGWAMAVFLGYQLVLGESRSEVDILMHALWPAGMLSAAVGLTQWLKLESSLGVFAVQTDIGDRAMGNLAQPNQLATFLLISLLAYTYIFERRIIGWLGFVLGIGFMTAVLVMTQSRAGMMGVAAIAGFLAWKRRSMASRLSLTQVLAWAALFFAAVAIFPSINAALGSAALRPSLTTTNDRLVIWQQVLSGISQAPWFGYGWNQTSTADIVGSASHLGQTPSMYAHNVLLDLLAWNGIPLGLLLIGLGGYWVFTRLKRVAGLADCYAMACLLPILGHSMVEFPFAYVYFLVLAGLMMGVVEGSQAARKSRAVQRSWSAVALTLWMLVGLAIAYEYLLVEEDLRVTRFENLNVGATDNAYQMPTIRLLTQLAAMQRAMRYKPVPHMDKEQLDELRRVVFRFPHGGMTLRYAMALAMNGEPDEARHMLAILHGMYGDRFYLSAKEVWHDKAEKYPELGAISFP